MNDDWNGAARQGFDWGAPRAAGRSARPGLPWRPGSLPEGAVRLLLVTEDQTLAAALLARLREAALGDATGATLEACWKESGLPPSG